MPGLFFIVFVLRSRALRAHSLRERYFFGGEAAEKMDWNLFRAFAAKFCEAQALPTQGGKALRAMRRSLR